MQMETRAKWNDYFELTGGQAENPVCGLGDLEGQHITVDEPHQGKAEKTLEVNQQKAIN